MERSAPAGAGPLFEAVASLTTAQRVLLTEIAKRREPATVASLAEELGLHQNSVRVTFEALSEAGLVGREIVNTPGRGRPSWGYFTMAPSDGANMVRQLSDLASVVAEEIREHADDPEAAAQGVGEKWANRMLTDVADTVEIAESDATTSDVVANVRLFFTSLGFGATVHPESETAVELRSCPFVDSEGLIDPLVCEIHRGMGTRAIGDLTDGRVDIELEPFASPAVCEVHITDNESSGL